MHKFNIGDKVVVTDADQNYPTYTTWATKHGLKNYATDSGNWATRGTVGKVISHGGHLVDADYLYAITVDGKDFILSYEGLELFDEAANNTVNKPTVDAILHLQSLLDLTGDGVQIIIQENELSVNVFNKTFHCENAEVLDEVCKVACYLARQEAT